MNIVTFALSTTRAAGSANGEPLVVVRPEMDSHGNPTRDVKVNIGEAISTGHYEVHYTNRKGPGDQLAVEGKVDGKASVKMRLVNHLPALEVELAVPELD